MAQSATSVDGEEQWKFDTISLIGSRWTRRSASANHAYAGFRMPVTSILAYLSGGMSIDEMLKEWPELEREDIYQALGFAAALMEEKVVPLEHR